MPKEPREIYKMFLTDTRPTRVNVNDEKGCLIKFSSLRDTILMTIWKEVPYTSIKILCEEQVIIQ